MTRAWCYKCQRAGSTCLCEHVRRVSSKTRICLLQHPKERRVAKNTAVLVKLCLERTVLISQFKPDLALVKLLPTFGNVGVLMPTPDSTLLTPDLGLDTLIIPDGTWSQARTILRDATLLNELPRYHLPPGPPSNYRVRKPPSDRHVSTIEATVRSLRTLEEGDYSELLDLFDVMVERWIEFLPEEQVKQIVLASKVRCAYIEKMNG